MRRSLLCAWGVALLAAATPAAADSVSGHWAISGRDAGHDFTLACIFAQAGQNLTGDCIDGPTGDSSIKGGRHHALTKGSVNGDQIAWTYHTSSGLFSFDVTYSGTRQGDHINGQLKAVGTTGAFTGARTGP